MEKFCESLTEHAKNIIDLKKLSKSINYWKVRDHCHYTGKYRGAIHSISNLKFNKLNKISVVFHNGSNYDYHFIIKELANDFEGKFECLGESTEKYKTFSVPIQKEVTDDGNENVVATSYKIKFIDSARFMTSSFSNLVDNFAEVIHKIKCKDCDCFLEYVKGNLIKYKCLSCYKYYSNKVDEELKNRFKNTFKFFNNDMNKFNKDFIKSYNEESNEGYFLEVDIQYPEKLQELYNDLPLLLEKMKFENFEKSS